ncbi:MAG: TMEM165/GDT1 family protein [Cyanobacteriota bacterium]|nr:TMEM165/GDT1 family protein [Cyanobacteriota bacterium]
MTNRRVSSGSPWLWVWLLLVAGLALGLGIAFLLWGQAYLATAAPRSLCALPAPPVPLPEAPIYSLLPPVSPIDQQPGDSAWQLVIITFCTVFVAEMGDKTQLATMLMSAQSRSPWTIFWGSASALVTASLISVLLGGGISQLLAPEVLQMVSGIGFIGIGLVVLWQSKDPSPSPILPPEAMGNEVHDR